MPRRPEEEGYLGLNDRDFAQFLRSLKDPEEIVTLAREWFSINGKQTSEGLETLTTALNNARQVFKSHPISHDADFSLDQANFAAYLRTLKHSEQRVIAGLEWFSKNGQGYGDALDLATTVFNNLT